MHAGPSAQAESEEHWDRRQYVAISSHGVREAIGDMQQTVVTQHKLDYRLTIGPPSGVLRLCDHAPLGCANEFRDAPPSEVAECAAYRIARTADTLRNGFMRQREFDANDPSSTLAETGNEEAS